MKKTFYGVAVAILAAVASLQSANAALVLGTSGGDYLGKITDGIPPSEENQVIYINFLKTLAAGAGDTVLPPNLPPGESETYNRQNSTLVGPFPTAVYPPGVKIDDKYTVDAGTYQYVLGKYGGGKDKDDKATSGFSLVWYFPNGAPGDVTLPTMGGGHGLSHVSMYNVVPEPSTYIAGGLVLLPLLFGLRTRFQRK